MGCGQSHAIEPGLGGIESNINLAQVGGTNFGLGQRPIVESLSFVLAAGHPGIPITGGVDTELPAAVDLADGMANPTAPAVAGHGMVWNGVSWDRAPGTTAHGLDVDVTRSVLPTGAATEATVAKRFAGAKTQRAVQITASGANTIVTPGSGNRIRLFWLGLSSSEDNTAEVLAIAKFGATEHYRWRMGAPGAFAHWEIIEGATDEALVIDLSAAQPVEVNYTYEEFT